MAKQKPKDNRVYGVVVNEGYVHPQIGNISGWEATIMRQFTINTVEYLDVEFTPNTIGKIPEKVKDDYFTSRIIFNKIRIRKSETTEKKVISRGNKLSQKQWYESVGKHEIDPTKVLSDSMCNSTVDWGKRRDFLSFVVVGTFTAILFGAISTCNEENEGSGSGGSWGRGFHSS